jgi:hypothetical protein
MNYRSLLRRISPFGVLAALAILLPLQGRCELDQTFDVLTVGARTYTNVTVTTKAKKYVMLMHSQGLANIKVADLSPELRRTLGYNEVEEQPKSKGEAIKKWANHTLATVKIGQVRAMELNVAKTWQEHAQTGQIPFIGRPSLQVIVVAASGALLVWMLFCSCLNKICKNAGKQSSALVWWPVLQWFPVLNAAGMKAYWILLPPIASLVWPFKISKACGKSAFTGICLLLPGIQLLAFLHLAFSSDSRRVSNRRARDDRRVLPMTLETA